MEDNIQIVNKRIPWNKGKKNIYTRETRDKISLKAKERIGNKNPFYGKHHSEKSKQKMSIKKRGQIGYFKGKKFTEEHKKNLSLACKGRKLTEEAKQKISLANKNRIMSEEWKRKIGIKSSIYGKTLIGSKNPFYGKYHTEFSKNKMRMAKLGKKLSEEHRKKMQEAKKVNPVWNKGLTKNNNEIVNKYSKSLKITKNTKEAKEKARLNRYNQIFPIKDTKIEIKIQNYLKQLGYTFFTHQYIKEIEHGYQCDILIPILNLVIEVDGNYWHKYPIGNDIDHIRTKELINKGFKVLRLWEVEINKLDIQEFQKRLENIKNDGGIENEK